MNFQIHRCFLTIVANDEEEEDEPEDQRRLMNSIQTPVVNEKEIREHFKPILN
jgi:hypothetical protein